MQGLVEDGVLHLETGLNHRLVEGYDALPGFIGRDLDIRLGWAVESVRWTESGVRVRSTAGDEVSARAAVCTLPGGRVEVGLGAIRAGAARRQAVGARGDRDGTRPQDPAALPRALLAGLGGPRRLRHGPRDALLAGLLRREGKARGARRLLHRTARSRALEARRGRGARGRARGPAPPLPRSRPAAGAARPPPHRLGADPFSRGGYTFLRPRRRGRSRAAAGARHRRPVLGGLCHRVEPDRGHRRGGYTSGIAQPPARPAPTSRQHRRRARPPGCVEPLGCATPGRLRWTPCAKSGR